MALIAQLDSYNNSPSTPAKIHRTHLDYLVEKGIISDSQLNHAKMAARTRGTTVESVFIKDLRVDKLTLGENIAAYFGCEYVPYNRYHPIPGDLLSKLNPAYLKRNLWVPLGRDKGKIKILVDNPRRLDKIQSINSLIHPGNYVLAVGLQEDINGFLDAFFGGFKEVDSGSIDEILANLDAPETEDAEPNAEVLKLENSGVVSLINRIIVDAYRMNCSDIHIEPYPGKSGAEIRFRVDGYCRRYKIIPYNHKRTLISRIKIMADLDISERRKPQDGKILFRKFYPLDIELRVATMPTAGGEEDVVMRILTAGEPMALGSMGMKERDHEMLLKMSEKPYGMLLVVGPTGSGKTTTLHSVLRHINRPETKIWTAEDPVEITQRGLRQVQVQPKIGFSFAAAMRSLLRADPDVIMVGEMRDHDTASIACEASLTGHLVMSTLHTNSAPETIVRLLDMGMDAFNFSDAILGILAQRLVRTLCIHCKEPYHPSREEFNGLARSYGNGFDALQIPYRKGLELYRAVGCERCRDSGYLGRTAIMEFLEATREIKALILNKPNVERLRQQADKDGMTTLMQDGIRKVFLGLTDIAQVRKVCI